jgi:hypothetical protein
MQKDSKAYDDLAKQATHEALHAIHNKSVQRLGFGAWADNVIMNFIEDNMPMMSMGKGKMSVESKDYNLYAEFDDFSYSIVVSSHTGDGWQIHERHFKFKEGEKK